MSKNAGKVRVSINGEDVFLNPVDAREIKSAGVSEKPKEPAKKVIEPGVVKKPKPKVWAFSKSE